MPMRLSCAMKKNFGCIEDNWASHYGSPSAQQHAIHSVAAGCLHLVTPLDLEELQMALLKGALPSDFETKLVRLAKNTLLHQFVEQHCRLFASLLVAAHNSSFIGANRPARERLLRVLAYVRKEND